MPADTRIGTKNYAVGKGQRQLNSDVQSARKVKQFTGEEINVSGDVAPLYLLTEAMKNSKKVYQAEYFHLEEDYLPTHVNLRAAVANSGVTAIPVEQGHEYYVTEGDILKDNESGELMLVTGFSGAGGATPTITVTRNFGGGTGDAIADDSDLMILSHSAAEGGGAPDGLHVEPAIKENYTQAFRQAFELSGRDLSSENYGKDEETRQKQVALEALMQKVEKAFLFQPVKLAPNSDGRSLTGGVDYWLSTNVSDVAGPLLEDDFIEDLIMPTFRRNARTKKKMMMFAGEHLRFHLDGFARDLLRYKTDDTGIGVQVVEYRTSFGTVEIVPHGLMTAIGDDDWAGMAYLLNMELIGKRSFADRKMILRPDIQDNDIDGRKWEYLTDEGLYMASEACHGKLTGITL